MDPGNGIFQYDGKVYTIIATGTQCQTATTTLSHLKSRKFTNKKVTVPDEIWSSLQEQSEHEQAVARENRKRKIGTPKEKKRTRLQQEYLVDKSKFNVEGLYRKDVQDGNDSHCIKYDCSVCGMYVAAHALIAHVASVEHKQKLAVSTYDEDHLFIKAERETCLAAERVAAGSKWCDTCQKWIGGPCWVNHIKGKAHLQMLPWEEQQRIQQLDYSQHPTQSDPYGVDIDRQYPVTPALTSVQQPSSETSVLSIINKFPADSIPLFCCGEDMWNTSIVFTAAEYTRLKKYRTQMCIQETSEWGNPSKPALIAGLVEDEDAMSLGVCYLVSRDTLLQLVEEKKATFQTLVEATQDSEAHHQCVTFKVNGVTNIPSVHQAAQQIVTATGSLGPNYALLIRIQHEYERQDWKENHFVELVRVTTRIMWPN